MLGLQRLKLKMRQVLYSDFSDLNLSTNGKKRKSYLLIIIVLCIIYTIYQFFFNPWKAFRLFPTINIIKVPANQIEDSKPRLTNANTDTSGLSSFPPSSSSSSSSSSLSKIFPLSNSFIKSNQFYPISLKTFTDPYPLIVGKPPKYDFQEEFMCSELEFEDSFEHTGQAYLNANLALLLNKINGIEEYKNLIQQAKKRFRPTIPEQKQWFRFGGSSVWLPQFKVHYMVSRVLYSPQGVPNKAYVSFLYIQIYDENWQELPQGTKLTIPFEEVKVKYQGNYDGSFTKSGAESKLGFRETEFPQILPIPFDYSLKTEKNKYYYGPEDPRILLHENPLGFEEPLIVFNMKDLKIEKRTMFMYKPFSNILKLLKKRNEKYAYVEKNWTPFFNPVLAKKDQINFIYTIVPLSILTCNVQLGICDYLQKGAKKNFNYVGALRGGTQLVPLPLADLPASLKSQLAVPKNRQIYLGWARAHLNKCGCGESMYRPNMILLIEDYNADTNTYYYKIGDVSSYFDFGAYVPPWTLPKKDTKTGQMLFPGDDFAPRHCEGRNVLIPNSIAYWQIKSVTTNNGRKTIENYQDSAFALSSTVSFNDYMGVTLSAADQDVSIVHLKGLLNYIVKLPSLFDEETVVLSDTNFGIRGSDWNNKCAMYLSHRYCREYALVGGHIEEDEPDDPASPV